MITKSSIFFQNAPITVRRKSVSNRVVIAFTMYPSSSNVRFLTNSVLDALNIAYNGTKISFVSPSAVLNCKLQKRMIQTNIFYIIILIAQF